MSRKSSHSLVSVVVVAFNSSDVIEDCLRPLVGHDDIEVIVWDNASSDDTLKKVAAFGEGVHVHDGPQNLGFARAVNAAARVATSDYLLLLNPDAEISAQGVRTLAARMSDNPSMGVLAPMVEQPQGRLSVLDAGRDPNLWRIFLHWTGISRLGRKFPILEGSSLRLSQGKSPRLVDWVSGACLMTSADAWRAVGGLCDHWFMYAEDIEYCIQVRRRGWTVNYDPAVRVRHAIGQSSLSSDAAETTINSAWITNLFDLYLREIAGSRTSAFAWKAIACGGLLSRSIAYRVRGLRTPSSINWRLESKKFRGHSRALWQMPLDSFRVGR